MKQVVKLLFLTFIVISQGCEKECGECFTPPEPFEFEFVDILTGENLFTNGTFSSSDIKVINLDDQSNIAFTFIDENDYNIIAINTIGWKTETANYSILIASENIFNLFVDAERLNDECCDYTEYKEIRILNSKFELNKDSGVYKILIE